MRYFIYASFVLVGFFVANIFGAIIGGGVAYWVVRAMESRRALHGIEDADWIAPLFQILGYLAKVDGTVSRMEVESARDIMVALRLDGGLTRVAMQSFNEGKDSDFQLNSVAQTLTSIFGRGTQNAVLFFHYMASICLADHNLSKPEERALGELAVHLGISELQLRHVFASFGSFSFDSGGDQRSGSYQEFEEEGSRTPGRRTRPSEIEQAYQVLEVSESATDSEIKRKYRQLLNQYHPDKLASKGLPASMMEFSKEQSAKIIHAWDVIKTARGIS